MRGYGTWTFLYHIVPPFLIFNRKKLQNSKSPSNCTVVHTYLGYITLGLAFSSLPSPSPSLFSAWFYLRLKDKMKISWPFSNQVSLTWLWTWYFNRRILMSERWGQQIGAHNRVCILEIGNIQWRHIKREQLNTIHDCNMVSNACSVKLSPSTYISLVLYWIT